MASLKNVQMLEDAGSDEYTVWRMMLLAYTVEKKSEAFSVLTNSAAEREADIVRAANGDAAAASRSSLHSGRQIMH